MANRILLIEDDPTMQTLLQTYLQFEGFEVILQNKDDTIEALLQTIRQEEPELILLDVYLRQLNGFDLLEAMRADAELQGIGVVMSSGADFRDRCLEDGADAFILKPYMPDELLKVIRQVISEERKPH